VANKQVIYYNNSERTFW